MNVNDTGREDVGGEKVWEMVDYLRMVGLLEFCWRPSDFVLFHPFDSLRLGEG